MHFVYLKLAPYISTNRLFLAKSLIKFSCSQSTNSFIANVLRSHISNWLRQTISLIALSSVPSSEHFIFFHTTQRFLSKLFPSFPVTKNLLQDYTSAQGNPRIQIPPPSSPNFQIYHPSSSSRSGHKPAWFLGCSRLLSASHPTKTLKTATPQRTTLKTTTMNLEQKISAMNTWPATDNAGQKTKFRLQYSKCAKHQEQPFCSFTSSYLQVA